MWLFCFLVGYIKITKVYTKRCYVDAVGNVVEWGQFWVVGCYCGVKLQFVHITRGWQCNKWDRVSSIDVAKVINGGGVNLPSQSFTSTSLSKLTSIYVLYNTNILVYRTELQPSIAYLVLLTTEFTTKIFKFTMIVKFTIGNEWSR